MSQRIEDGGAAFPFAFRDAEGHPLEHRAIGMTLRDYFAGQALAGLLASNARYGGKTDNREALAADAYASADAMIAARQMGLQAGGEAHG